ncbi:MAG TPA: monovalent cation/H+ antiporter complex subunit F [Solirubrobacteraceae bacterium]|jgi:multisubunit Na+/H+ antiporter MnhF subunit|nr:monovalent cation/H+ antiporter complex subunit F [Solirubrobacteraceae bacterium]
MNEWTVVALVLIVALVPCLAVCVLAGATHALAAYEVASTLLTTVLMLLSEGFHRQPFVDLAIVFALMSIVGALAFARLMERDL